METWSRPQAVAFLLQPHRALHFLVCGVLPVGNYFAPLSTAVQWINRRPSLGDRGHADRTGTLRTPVWRITICNYPTAPGPRMDSRCAVLDMTVKGVVRCVSTSKGASSGRWASLASP
jgi:hypothetical protein